MNSNLYQKPLLTFSNILKKQTFVLLYQQKEEKVLLLKNQEKKLKIKNQPFKKLNPHLFCGNLCFIFNILVLNPLILDNNVIGLLYKNNRNQLVFIKPGNVKKFVKFFKYYLPILPLLSILQSMTSWSKNSFMRI